jgi:AraC-like DNA-binding protein
VTVPSATETLSARVLLRVVEFCRRRGHDGNELCRRAGLSLEQLGPETRIPYAAVARLSLLALELTGDPDFGLHLAEDVGETRDYDPGLLALMASPTVGAALERLRVMQRYWGDGARASFHSAPSGLVICYRLLGAEGEYARHADECALAELALGVRVVSERPLCARVVRFRHRTPASTQAHRRLFACPIEFGAPETQIEFSREVLETPLPHANPTYLANFERQVAATLSRLPDLATASASVREACRTRLATGGCTVATTARLLGSSARTLQRRLRAEGTSFARVLDELRHELALEELARQTPLAEIAARLGYADVSAFHHAFRRWTGSSPARFGPDSLR